MTVENQKDPDLDETDLGVTCCTCGKALSTPAQHMLCRAHFVAEIKALWIARRRIEAANAALKAEIDELLSLQSGGSAGSAVTAERAAEIVGRCNQHVFWWTGATTALPSSLACYSLAELLEANHRLSATMHCDDRLVAALYSVYHYEPEDSDRGGLRPIARAPGRALLSIKADD